MWFSKIRSCKPGCASASTAAHFLWSTVRFRQDISAASFCSCRLLWRTDEWVLLPCFDAQPDIFAVMNCCVVALNVFSSDLERWSFIFSSMRHKLRGVRVDGYAYYVKKLRQNFGLETWIWRQIVTSQTAHTKYKWPSYATEWNPPHENFLRTPLNELVVNQLVFTDCSFFVYQHWLAWMLSTVSCFSQSFNQMPQFFIFMFQVN